MKRSRIENNDLKFNIRVNGRIFAAFIRERAAKEEALSIMRENPTFNVELSNQDGTIYNKVQIKR